MNCNPFIAKNHAPSNSDSNTRSVINEINNPNVNGSKLVPRLTKKLIKAPPSKATQE